MNHINSSGHSQRNDLAVLFLQFLDGLLGTISIKMVGISAEARHTDLWKESSRSLFQILILLTFTFTTQLTWWHMFPTKPPHVYEITNT